MSPAAEFAMMPSTKRQRTESNPHQTSPQGATPFEHIQLRLARLEAGLQTLTERSISPSIHGSQINIHINQHSGQYDISQQSSTDWNQPSQPNFNSQPGPGSSSQHPTHVQHPQDISQPQQAGSQAPYIPQPSSGHQAQQHGDQERPQAAQFFQQPASGCPPPQSVRRPDGLLPRIYHPATIPTGMTIPGHEQLIAGFSDDFIRRLLNWLVPLDSSGLLHTAVVDSYVDQKLREQARVINFDSYIKTASYAINTHSSHLSGSELHEKSSDVTEQILGCVGAIGTQVKATSSYGTRLNALETLYKIAMKVLYSNGALAGEVKKRFESEYRLIETMVKILEGMSQEERIAAGCNVSEAGKGTLVSKMERIRWEAEAWAIPGLDVSTAHLLLSGGSSNGAVNTGAKQPAAQQCEQTPIEIDANDGPWNFESFDACASKVNYIINAKYARLGGSKQYDMSGNARQEIEAEIELIKQKASKGLSLDSKGKALLALISIGCSVVASEGGVIAHEIRKDYQRDTSIVDLINLILKSIHPNDGAAFYRKIGLKDQIEDLISQAEGYAIHCFDGLRDIIDG